MLVLLVRLELNFFKMIMKQLISLVFTFLFLSLSAQELEQAKGLSIGDKAPLGQLQNADGESIDLQEALKEGPIILVFYRGQWCPYCNRHMAALSEIADSLEGIGVQLFAISPENPEYLKMMEEKSESRFDLLYDSHYTTIEAFDLAFLPSKAKRLKYNSVLGANLAEAHGDSRELLPVPATFLIDQKGIIRWRHFDPDYRERSKPEELLAEAQKLR